MAVKRKHILTSIDPATGEPHDERPRFRFSTSRVRHGKEIGSRTQRSCGDGQWNYGRADGQPGWRRQKVKAVLSKHAKTVIVRC
jgi:hypothetical protein